MPDCRHLFGAAARIPALLRAASIVAVVSLLPIAEASAQGPPPVPTPTLLTYQGLLRENGVALQGLHDLRFSLWNAPTDGAQIGQTICIDGVQVTNGLLTVPLDFGAAALQAQPRYLQIAVRADAIPANCGAGAYTTLLPRQSLTAAPFSAATRGINVAPDGKVGLGGAPPDRGLTLFGGVNIRDSVGQGFDILTDRLVIANADTEDVVYRYDAPPIDRHLFYSGATPSLSLDLMGRMGLGLDTPLAPVHLRSFINRPGYLRLDGSRQVAGGSVVNVGPRTPGAVVAGTNSIAVWSNVDAGRVPDGASAVATFTAASTSILGYELPPLTFSNLGFSIPANNTVVGITVELFTNNSVAFACAGSVDTDFRVQLRSGSVVGTNTFGTAAVSSASTAAVGGPASLFGTTWTPANINSANFSVVITPLAYCGNIIPNPVGPGTVGVPCTCLPTGQWRIDGLRVTIHTTSAGAFTESFNWSAGFDAGQSTFAIAPTSDLTSPTLNISTDGRVGVGVLPSATPLSAKLTVAGDLHCTNLVETSSTNVKHDIAPLADPLQSVLALRPVRFRWDDAHGGRADLGLLAEDVRTVLPELVTTDAQGRAAGINYGRVGVLAVGAIAELRERHRRELEALRADHAREQADQAERFNGQLRALMERVAALEARTLPADTPKPTESSAEPR